MRPLVVEQSREVHLLLQPEADTLAFQIITEEGGARTVHARGLARTEAEFTPGSVDLSAIQQRCAQQLTGAALYEQFAQGGLHYGESFQVISGISYESQEALAHLQLKQADAAGSAAFALATKPLGWRTSGGSHFNGQEVRSGAFLNTPSRIHSIECVPVLPMSH